MGLTPVALPTFTSTCFLIDSEMELVLDAADLNQTKGKKPSEVLQSIAKGSMCPY